MSHRHGHCPPADSVRSHINLSAGTVPSHGHLLHAPLAYAVWTSSMLCATQPARCCASRAAARVCADMISTLCATQPGQCCASRIATRVCADHDLHDHELHAVCHAAGTVLRIASCRVRRAPRSCGLPPRLLPAAEMALVCGGVGQAAAALEPLPLCPLAQVPVHHSCYLLSTPALCLSLVQPVVCHHAQILVHLLRSCCRWGVCSSTRCAASSADVCHPKYPDDVAASASLGPYGSAALLRTCCNLKHINVLSLACVRE